MEDLFAEKIRWATNLEMPDASMCCCIATKGEDEISEVLGVTTWTPVDTKDPSSLGAGSVEQPLEIEAEETVPVLPIKELSDKLDTLPFRLNYIPFPAQTVCQSIESPWQVSGLYVNPVLGTP